MTTDVLRDAGADGEQVRFPNQIRRLRRDAGITVRALAEIVGVSRNHVWMVEQGRRVPSAITLHDMAKALDVSVQELFNEKWSADRGSRVHALRASVVEW
jgi:transcriptional regulator with XRE-family HTH domain